MASWRERARVGVAVGGIAVAVLVYASLGTRQPAAPLVTPTRLDPEAILESVGAEVQRGRGVEREFDVTSERQLAYEDGSTKLVGVEINVRGRAGRDFVLTGEEAEATGNQGDLLLTGQVKLSASDGFELHAERASFTRTDALVRAAGPVSFGRDRLTGTGIGMSYHEATDVLTIADSAHVMVAAGDTEPAMELRAGIATLSRAEDLLRLDGDVRVVQGTRVLEGDRAVVQMSPNEDVVRFIELRGNARVGGEDPSLESMEAANMDLDYAEDGQRLEHVALRGRARVAGGSSSLESMEAEEIALDYDAGGQRLERVLLVGHAAIAMAGQEADRSGRLVRGERLELLLAPDGAVTSVTGREGVQLTLPASDAFPARTVRALALDGFGAARAGLTSVRFSGDVEYREDEGRGSSPRRAQSQRLTIALVDDLVSRAVFGGGVRFEELDFQGSAADATYQPAEGTLQLTGHEAGAPPRVADARITVEADVIQVTLRGRDMTARGSVRTTLRPPPDAEPGSRQGDAAPRGGGSRLPGLLEERQAANLNADVFEYDGTSGKGVYGGNASLWQGETAIRAERIVIDQQTGDLEAVGNARSTIVLDGGMSVGRAGEIRYEDAHRVLTYRRAPGASGPAPVGVAGLERETGLAQAAGPPPPRAQLSGPHGDLMADRIELILAGVESRAQRLEAYTGVTVRLGERTATGARLTYFAGDERYVLLGTSTAPVTVVDGCRETTGRTLTFFGSTDRIVVEGNEEVRTHTKSGGPCASPPGR